MKVIYHDPDKSAQKLVLEPGEWFCPRREAAPEAMGQALSAPKRKRGRPKKFKGTAAKALKRGTGNWL